MTSLFIAPVALAALLLVALVVPAAQAVDVTNVTDFKGSITDVGVQRGPNQIGGVELRSYGTFVYRGPIDLTSSTATFELLFAELGPGGAGELMKTANDASFLPITLPSDDSSEVDEAKYETPGSYRPKIRFELENDLGEFEFELKLDRGLMRNRPKLCKLDPVDRKIKTFITQAFVLNDGVNPPLHVSTMQPWECTKPDRYHMRSR
jgi:hypothetical protein